MGRTNWMRFVLSHCLVILVTVEGAEPGEIVRLSDSRVHREI